MTYEEFDKRCDELENAPLPERKTFFADVLAGETEKTDVRMMAYFRYALLFYREGDFRTAREILEPFIIDYKSYRYRPEIIACFNLVGVVAYYVQEYALSRFYIHEGLKIAREHSEVSRYAYEYNNLAVTYLAQQDYEKALEAIREAEKNMPVSDETMHAYVYRNLTEICCHLDRLDEAKDALAKCLAYRGREILPEEVWIVNTLLTYKAGDTAGYKHCCAELREHLPQLHAEKFLASCKVLFDCGMDAGDNAQVEWVLDAMDAYLRRDPKEAQVGLRAETCRYEYAKATGNTALMLAALPGGQALLSGVSPEEEALYLQKGPEMGQREAIRAIRTLGTALEHMTRGSDQRIELELALFSLSEPPQQMQAITVQTAPTRAAQPEAPRPFAAAVQPFVSAPVQPAPAATAPQTPAAVAEPAPAVQQTPPQPAAQEAPPAPADELPPMPEEPPVQQSDAALPWDEPAPQAPPPEEPEPISQPEQPAPAEPAPATEEQPTPAQEHPADPVLTKPRSVAQQGTNPFPYWGQIVQKLEGIDPMLYMYLRKSKAYFDGTRVLIDGGKTFRDFIRVNKDSQKLIKKLIAEVSGVPVPIGPYEPKTAGKTASNAEQSLLALEKLGLEVSIEDTARKKR